MYHQYLDYRGFINVFGSNSIPRCSRGTFHGQYPRVLVDDRGATAIGALAASVSATLFTEDGEGDQDRLSLHQGGIKKGFMPSCYQ